MKREDFFKSVKTAEKGEIVNVSQGDLGCLIQVGHDYHYRVAYLKDYQVRKLRDALTQYLRCK